MPFVQFIYLSQWKCNSKLIMKYQNVFKGTHVEIKTEVTMLQTSWRSRVLPNHCVGANDEH